MIAPVTDRARNTDPQVTIPRTWISSDFEPGLVSVIIPTYNRAALLVEAMDSVYAQTYRPIELIVVDDGSSDETSGLVPAWGRRHASAGFQTFFHKQPKQGAPAARNRGIRASRGEFLQFLDSDDVLDANKIALHVSALEQSPFDCVYGDWVEGPDRACGKRCARPQQGDALAALVSKQWIALFAYLVRREAVVRAGPWAETLMFYQDAEFFWRIAAEVRQFEHVPHISGLYRKGEVERVGHLKRTTGGASKAAAVYPFLRRLELQLKQRQELYPSRADAIARRYFGWAKDCWLERQFVQAYHYLRRTIRTAPQWAPRNPRDRIFLMMGSKRRIVRLRSRLGRSTAKT